MKKWLTFIAELSRMIILCLLFVSIIGWAERRIYGYVLNIVELNTGLLLIGNLILFYVVYQNYFQFSGWYKSVHVKKLSKTTTGLSIGIGAVLIISPVLF